MGFLPKTLLTCILLSHNKPKLVQEAIRSVQGQTYPTWETLLIDSGPLYDAGTFRDLDPRFRVIRSAETDDIRRTRNPASWCLNRYAHRAKGAVICYLCDDDVFYPQAFSVMVSCLKTEPETFAWYASQDFGAVLPDGTEQLWGERRALHPAGRYCGGVRLDCVHDYLQFFHRPEVLDWVSWSESLEDKQHADGLFMEAVGKLTCIEPVDIKIGMNRRSTESVNQPLHT